MFSQYFCFILVIILSNIFLVSGQRADTSLKFRPKLSTPCPCDMPYWCYPIKDTKRKEVFAFSVKNDTGHWQKYDWSKVTTVVMVGYHNDHLMCMAHGLKKRVSYIAIINIDFQDENQRQKWIQDQVTYVQQHFFDGLNFDYENSIAMNNHTLRNAYTKLVAETNTYMKKIFPYFQVSVDVAWKRNIDSRYYDYVGLAKNSDFLFVMAYDEQSQIYGECVSMPNSGIDRALEGLNDYLNAGISKDKLVLGVPWYGYIYPCEKLEQEMCYLKHVPFRGVNCSDAAGTQYAYSNIDSLSESYFVRWNDTSMTPYFSYLDHKDSTFKQVQFDNSQSLYIKYQMAIKKDIRGVGMWTIDFLPYDDTPAAEKSRKEMFGALPVY